jgi:HEAT repeat protein
MMRYFYAIAVVLIAASGFTQNSSNPAALYAKLIQPSTTDAAAPQLLDLAKHDPAARELLSVRLRGLIADRQSDEVWANAVRLSGQLKLSSALPSLKQALSRAPVRGGYDATGPALYTFSRGARLDFDIVGRALADIGDPSVPFVVDIFSTGDSNARKRAAWILINIDSQAAQKALSDHLPIENDLGIKRLIQNKLHLSN